MKHIHLYFGIIAFCIFAYGFDHNMNYAKWLFLLMSIVNLIWWGVCMVVDEMKKYIENLKITWISEK